MDSVAPLRHPLRCDEDYNEYVKDFYRKVEDYDWNDVTDNWRGLESWLHRARERKMKQLISRFGTGGRYLDVGCGTGLILRHLPAGAVGIDINPRHVSRARQYVPQAKVQLGDAEQLDFPEQSFGTVVCTEVIEHVVHPEKVLAGIWRVLEPGGILLGSTPRRSPVWWFRFLSSTHYHNEPFHNEFRKSELSALLKDFAIEQLKSEVAGAVFFFVAKKAEL